MKLAIDASVVSSQRLAAFLGLLTAAACLADWPLRGYAERLFLATSGVIIGAVLAKLRFWFLLHPTQEVLRQIQSTLQTCCISYDVSNSSVRVVSTGTKASVRGWGPFSLVYFEVLDPRSKKERFLVEVLTKYLRFIGRTDAHG